MSVPLAVIEDIIDASGIALAIEDMLPAGVRGRQLSVRTLLAGLMLALADGRPAHLTRVRQALTGPPQDDQERLGVISPWQDGPHQLTYRQAEHTFRLITWALAKDKPGGAPSRDLQQACDALLEASIPHRVKTASSSLAADWTDVEAWARPVPPPRSRHRRRPRRHRNVNLKIARGEMFYGYYLSAVTMVADEHGPAVPELTRRISAFSGPPTGKSPTKTHRSPGPGATAATPSAQPGSLIQSRPFQCRMHPPGSARSPLAPNTQTMPSGLTARATELHRNGPPGTAPGGTGSGAGTGSQAAPFQCHTSIADVDWGEPMAHASEADMASMAVTVVPGGSGQTIRQPGAGCAETSAAAHEGVTGPALAESTTAEAMAADTTMAPATATAALRRDAVASVTETLDLMHL